MAHLVETDHTWNSSLPHSCGLGGWVQRPPLCRRILQRERPRHGDGDGSATVLFSHTVSSGAPAEDTPEASFHNNNEEFSSLK